ncbi:MAG: hypothetical protein M1826_006999 [Phylliscum demangeonii]|nr:MAG: hypothetical protein M1826_006999 [Phylliscum demangeonii]
MALCTTLKRASILQRRLTTPGSPSCPPHPCSLLRQSFHSSAPKAVIKPFLLADIGEGIRECEVIQWFVTAGNRVEQFDKLCEVQSDKASVEISSRYDGVIKKLHYEPGEMAIVGQPLADIDVDEDAEAVPDWQKAATAAAEETPSPRPEPPGSSRHGALATPAVRGLAKAAEVDITAVLGTGKDGRVLAEDLSRFVDERRDPTIGRPCPEPARPRPEGQRMPLTPIQQQMFKSMTASLSIPHLVYADEYRLDRLEALRVRLNQDPRFRIPIDPHPHPPLPSPSPSPGPAESIKASLLPFIIKALSIALSQHPLLNARLDIPAGAGAGAPSGPARRKPTPSLLLRPHHHIGLAIATAGGLVVPNIQHVERKSIADIARDMHHLQALAHAGRLAPAHLRGATFTVSNVGSVGGTYVSPLIRGVTRSSSSSRTEDDADDGMEEEGAAAAEADGEVAILAIGRARIIPVFADPDPGSDADAESSSAGDAASSRVRRGLVAHFSWSADHRVLDGAAVARCSESLRLLLERPERMLLHLR